MVKAKWIVFPCFVLSYTIIVLNLKRFLASRDPEFRTTGTELQLGQPNQLLHVG